MKKQLKEMENNCANLLAQNIQFEKQDKTHKMMQTKDNINSDKIFNENLTLRSKLREMKLDNDWLKNRIQNYENHDSATQPQNFRLENSQEQLRYKIKAL